MLDERERMECKVACMLCRGLSVHIVNYCLEWDGKPNAEVAKNPLEPIARVIHCISIFNSHVDADAPISFSDLPDCYTTGHCILCSGGHY